METAMVTIGPKCHYPKRRENHLGTWERGAYMYIYLLADARWCGERVRRGLAHGVVCELCYVQGQARSANGRSLWVQPER